MFALAHGPKPQKGSFIIQTPASFSGANSFVSFRHGKKQPDMWMIVCEMLLVKDAIVANSRKMA